MKIKSQTISVILTGMFAAVVAIMSQLSIPLPTGVPITLQTFTVALCGYILGARLGCTSILIWLAVGAAGMPVFSNFRGGFGFLFGYTGGFLFGFPIMALLCGIGRQRPKLLGIAAGILGLAITHLFGCVGYMRAAGVSLPFAAATVSVPYLIKDCLSVAAAWGVGREIYKRLEAANILPNRQTA